MVTQRYELTLPVRIDSRRLAVLNRIEGLAIPQWSSLSCSVFDSLLMFCHYGLFRVFPHIFNRKKILFILEKQRVIRGCTSSL
jgi:hypothetical protein